MSKYKVKNHSINLQQLTHYYGRFTSIYHHLLLLKYMIEKKKKNLESIFNGHQESF